MLSYQVSLRTGITCSMCHGLLTVC
uniref:Uncharacterized protein n=1 Tax=Anguilla anguilla TaxID=7936 RepID=A0A0E9RF53_ANGAN